MSVHNDIAATIPSTEFRFTSTDGMCVACARWDSRGPVRGVVQIAHGMGEHTARYVDVIEDLVSVGLTVYENGTDPGATYVGVVFHGVAVIRICQKLYFNPS